MKIDLPDNVINLEIFRADRQLKALKGDCPHHKLGIDPLDGLYCLDCKRQLNAVEWIIQELQQFHTMQAQRREIRRQADDLSNRHRTKCIHCSKMTPIRIG